MKAVIMCGGMGSRMLPITELVPKPLLTVCGTPLLELLIRKLSDSGADTIYVTLGYMAGEIAAYLDRHTYTVPVVQVTERSPLGTAGGVRHALAGVRDDVAVVSGDNIFSFDLRDAYSKHRESQAAVTLLGCRRSDPRDYGTIRIDDEGNMIEFIEKPSWSQADSDIINTGIYFFGPEVLSMIPDGRFYDFANDLFPEILAKRMPFRCILAQGEWGDLGDERSYAKVNREAFSGVYGTVAPKERLLTEDKLLQNGTVLYAPSVIGKNVRFGNDCQVGAYSVVGDGCVFGERVRFSESMCGDNCRFESDMDCTGAYLGSGSTVGNHTEIRRGAVLAGSLTVGSYVKILSGAKIWPGCRVEDCHTVSQALQCESPQDISLTASGVSGKAFKELALPHVFNIGAAVASAGSLCRIGVASDDTSLCAVYREAVKCGLRACGAAVYDFGGCFRAQCHFLSYYCSLDFFINISADDDVVNLSFRGKKGLPVTRRLEREIASNYRYAQFRYAGASGCTDVFAMRPIRDVYRAFLERSLPESDGRFCVCVDCENRVIFEMLVEIFRKKNYRLGYGGLQFIINASGEKFYAVEKGRAFSYDRILTVCCKDIFEQGGDAAVGEEAPGILEKIAQETGRNLYRVSEAEGEASEAAAELYCESFWTTDALFLIVRLLSVLSEQGKTLSELSDALPDCFVKRLSVEYTVPPYELRRFLLRNGASRSQAHSGYFEMEDERGTVRLKPDSSGRRVRVLAESESMEISRELTADIACKIKNCSIDNLTQIE